MKVGLLVCDSVNDEFLHIGGNYDDMFCTLFPDLQLVPYPIHQQVFPKNFSECDAWMTTGSRHSANDYLEWIAWLKSFILELYNNKIPFVGICFGHQVLAAALGGKIAKATNGWSVGIHEFSLLTNLKWMNPSVNTFNICMMCQDQVTTLPPESQLLAISPNCPVAMYLVRDHMLGIQGHPEFSKEYTKALIDTRQSRIGIEIANAGVQSLKCFSPDSRLIAYWIKNFLLAQP